MFTTNMASHYLPTTYVQRRSEVEKLLKVSRQIEQLALNDPAFEDHPDFQRLQVEYDSQLRNVLSLTV